MKYTGQYIWPPRPGGAVPPFSKLFQKLEQDPDWFAQAKLNGSNTLMVLTRKGDVSFFNRHHAKSYLKPLAEQVEFFKALKKFAPLVLNLESLQNKVPTLRNHLYVFDVLVVEGKWQVGVANETRQKTLREVLQGSVSTPYRFAHEVGPQVWLAQNFQKNWGDLIEAYQKYNWFEGLMLKRHSGKLEPGFREKNNGGWSLRARIKDA